jgi:hypothetical protein
MADVSTRSRRKRRLNNQKARENKAFSKFKRSARYGSKLHRQRISQGVLRNIYGRPLRSKYTKVKNPRRVAGYNTKKRIAAVNHFNRTRKRRAKHMR